MSVNTFKRIQFITKMYVFGYTVQLFIYFYDSHILVSYTTSTSHPVYLMMLDKTGHILFTVVYLWKQFCVSSSTILMKQALDTKQLLADELICGYTI